MKREVKEDARRSILFTFMSPCFTPALTCYSRGSMLVNLIILPVKILLVLFNVLVKVTRTMKRLYTLIALLGLVGFLAGCGENTGGGGGTQTNAPATPTPPASTNK